MAKLPSIKRGATFRVQYEFAEVDENDVESVLDLTGYTLTSDMKRKDTTGADVTFEDVAELSVAILDAVNGVAELTAPGGTDDWPIGDLVFDIRMESPAGDIDFTPTLIQPVCERLTDDG